MQNVMKSKGLGDTIAKITKATGVDKVAQKWLKRQEWKTVAAIKGEIL